MTVTDGILSSYLARTRFTLQEAAITLRTVIKKEFDESISLKWPVTADVLGALTQDQLPEELLKFLHVVFSGQDPKTEKCEKMHRLIYSTGQDICRAVFICLIIRHLYFSKQLTQILNRMRDCRSYQYDLEVEAALTEAFDNTSTHLTPHIVIGDSNLVFHSETSI